MDDNNINNPENQEEMPEELSGEKIIKVNLENQMKSAYIDYSMSSFLSPSLIVRHTTLRQTHKVTCLLRAHLVCTVPKIKETHGNVYIIITTKQV